MPAAGSAGADNAPASSSEARFASCAGSPGRIRVLTARAIGSDDFGDRRAWLAKLLSYQVLLWIPFGFYTALELIDGPPELAVLLVGGGGVAAFAYGNTRGLRPVIGAAALAFIAAVWYWGVERGGALGAVFALALTAGLLFWISGRSGDPDE